MTIRVTFDGILGADPDIKYNQNGDATARVRVAHTERRKNPQTGKWEDGQTTWATVFVSGYAAENVAALRKGDRVHIAGAARLGVYKDQPELTINVQHIPTYLKGQRDTSGGWTKNEPTPRRMNDQIPF